ncbi:ubiquinone-dependent pyruvate dehydrogenase [Orlajensenia leifsoniae]|uniref:Ubiquinone-dependent pyruvate dehydrogenase n=1 Tax=Orlajensenia leifsoniae TaxID=2561933 RepID=A0A4Y9RAE5_9MICO|nr:ubiquinone-dependent pyruvate dehydrogenase [Leifsonia flava]TFW00187.1 ubiquinone-dependent pyruvate dehydrogenase [Leifsonia flava]
MSNTIAALIVETLAESGVRRIYGLPGDSLNGLTEAIRRHGGISWMHVRHEEAAAFAAAGESAVTGDLAVAAASCGPGNLHLINGLFDAQRSRVPVLVIAAHIPSSEIGTNYFQETHPQELFRECSVYSELATTIDQFPYVLEIAMRTALEKRGVAVVVIPGDLLLADIPWTRSITPIRATASITVPSEEQLAEAVRVLDTAERVTILAGAGCAGEGAHRQLIAVAQRLQAPVVHTLRGKESVEPANPYDVGMTGLLGLAPGFHAINDCDVLLMIGTDFPYRDFYPEHAIVIQIDIRGEQIGRRTAVDIPLVGTTEATLAALAMRLRAHSGRTHLDKALRGYAKARHELDHLAREEHNHSPLHPQFVARMVDEIADDDAVFIPDVGTPVIWAARYLRMNGRRRLIGSFNHGSMANALPHAIGVQASHPGRQVVTLSGDGGLAMMLGDLLTLQQLHLPVKMVVFNNGALGFVELEMKASGFVNFGTELTNPDFSAIARALGMHAERVDQPAQLGTALRAAFSHDGSALVEVMTARQELAFPPRIGKSQVEGVALYATRSVLSGRADELIELVRTNVTRRVLS